MENKMYSALVCYYAVMHRTKRVGEPVNYETAQSQELRRDGGKLL